eukprot:scaffold3359_cov123-Cylindrotheca_fusiformis.AAC.21
MFDAMKDSSMLSPIAEAPVSPDPSLSCQDADDDDGLLTKILSSPKSATRRTFNQSEEDDLISYYDTDTDVSPLSISSVPPRTGVATGTGTANDPLLAMPLSEIMNDFDTIVSPVPCKDGQPRLLQSTLMQRPSTWRQREDDFEICRPTPQQQTFIPFPTSFFEPTTPSSNYVDNSSVVAPLRYCSNSSSSTPSAAATTTTTAASENMKMKSLQSAAHFIAVSSSSHHQHLTHPYQVLEVEAPTSTTRLLIGSPQRLLVPPGATAADNGTRQMGRAAPVTPEPTLQKPNAIPITTVPAAVPNTPAAGVQVELTCPPPPPPPRAPHGVAPMLHTQSNIFNRYRKKQLINWGYRYEEAKQFAQIHGHCVIPSFYPPNPELSRWAKRQRHEYHVFTRRGNKGRRGRKSAMSKERLELLQKIGFCLDLNEAGWSRRYRELCDYQKTHNHTLVHRSENEKLSIWVKAQRRQYKLMKRGDPSHMTAERLDMLQKIDFAFEVNNTSKLSDE